MFMAELNTEQVKALRALLSERTYQLLQLGNAKRHEGQPEMTPGEHILCMEKCLADARAAWYAPDGGVKCLDHIRKVVALGFACMELHGAPLREIPERMTGVASQAKAAREDDDERRVWRIEASPRR
jgi:hypothetical protein